MTRDWITNEIFRRVEPNGRTMGEFMREELCTDKMLGSRDIICGLHDEDNERCISV
jgi:hypothetical protein